MFYKSFIIITLVAFGNLSYAQGSTKFLGFELNIPLLGNMNFQVKANLKSIERAFARCEQLPFTKTLETLDSLKHALYLVDWPYFELIKAYINTYQKDESHSSFLLWFFLGKSGYKTYLNFEKNKLRVYVSSDDKVFGLPKIGNKYCLNCTGQSLNVTSSGLNHFSNGKNFEFAIDQVPKMREPQTIKKEVIIDSNLLLKSFNVSFILNKSWVTFLTGYPNLELPKLYRTPLSLEAQSLIDELKSIIDNMTTLDAARLLLSFVRNYSSYVPDEDLFGKEKWMTPEEALFYPSGDCDDKSSLFYYLVREVLGLQAAILVYDKADHVNVAIQLDDLRTPNLFIDGNPYYICETTDSSDLEDIGGNMLHTKYRYRILK